MVVEVMSKELRNKSHQRIVALEDIDDSELRRLEPLERTAQRAAFG